ncbi:MAG TPA: nucleotide sugar dehydrogenase [Coriobacteriia bacterium]|nr:nucleotide sugar dehydrogenase [Coriobacteriia bacterium]
MTLKERIESGEAVYGVVGLGYVGLPLAVEMASAEHRVIGFDVVADKVTQVNAGTSYIGDVPSERIAPLVSGGLIEATTDFSRIAECDAVAICVPTPLDAMKEPDVSYMVSAAEQIMPHLKPGVLVTLESTTYPGTTEEVLQPILERSGLKVGESMFLAFSPERVDPGNTSFSTKNTPKVVGGVTPECTEVASAFYGSFLDSVIPMSSTRAAEMTKLLENIFRCVNIALVNELLVLSERMGIDIWEVVDAAKTKPFGFMPFYPGPGLGGHCIPIDPFYLSWKARQYDFHTEFIELAGKVNEDMPYYVVTRLMDALNRVGIALSKSRVLVLGIAYKSDIDDMRESPAIRTTELLLGKGADVTYHDPYVESFEVGGKRIERRELTEEVLSAVDAVLVITAHHGVDYALVAEKAPLVLDTRNALKDFHSDNIVRL